MLQQGVQKVWMSFCLLRGLKWISDNTMFPNPTNGVGQKTMKG